MNKESDLLLTLCQHEESILLNEAILKILGRPQQIHLMINQEKCMLLLQPCETADRGAVVVPDGKIVQFPISGRSLLKHIRRLTGWTDYDSRIVQGYYMPEHNVVLFDLREAVPVIVEEDGSSETY